MCSPVQVAASSVYSLHKRATRSHIARLAQFMHGVETAEVISELCYDLPATYKHHMCVPCAAGTCLTCMPCFPMCMNVPSQVPRECAIAGRRARMWKSIFGDLPSTSNEDNRCADGRWDTCE
jgi:hypothetical protein